MDKAFVGVHHLFQVYWLLRVVREGSVAVKVLVGLDDLVGGSLGADDLGAEDASGKVAAIGDEVNVDVLITLYLPD